MFVTLSPIFVSHESDFANFLYLQMNFWGEVHHSDVCVCAFFRMESGIHVLAGIVPSSQTVGSKMRTPWATKLVRKMAKCEFGKFTSMEKYNQLLFKTRIYYFYYFTKWDSTK